MQWFYQVLIENQGPTPVQLVSRLYHIQDQHGNTDVVSGQGVVNMMPVLTPRSRSFQFVSSITLSTPSGLMGCVPCAALGAHCSRDCSGSFAFVELLPGGVHGRTIDCSIPTFQLHSPEEQPAAAHFEAEYVPINVYRSRKDDDPRY